MASNDFPAPETSFRRRVYGSPRSAVVLSVPHSGTATTGFEGSLAPTLDVRGDADLLVDSLYGVGLPALGSASVPEALGIPSVVALLSRFICDMNRHPDDVSAAAVPDHPSPKNADGRGFVWAVTTTGTPALARPLTVAEWQARRAVHAAYHREIAESLQAARDRFGFAVLIDGHSMPSVGRSGHKDPGRARADIVPGDRDGTSCARSLSELAKTNFKAAGYSVAFNDPYKGGFITAHHGRPADGIHAIQIEVRRDLYMQEQTFTPAPQAFARLQATLGELLTAVVAWRP